jgi:hypothetical protein
MKQGIQDTLKRAGEYACYFLCLCELAERRGAKFDLLQTIDSFYGNNLLANDFTVKNAGGIFSALTGERWTHIVTGNEYRPAPGELLVEEWYNPRTRLVHFRLKDWDSLDASVTVKEGYVRSYRVLRKA